MAQHVDLNPAWTLVLVWRIYVRQQLLRRAMIESGAVTAYHPRENQSRGLYQMRESRWGQ